MFTRSSVAGRSVEERISDTAIYNRLKACVPWVKAMLQEMMGASIGPLIEGNLRFVVVDGGLERKERSIGYTSRWTW